MTTVAQQYFALLAGLAANPPMSINTRLVSPDAEITARANHIHAVLKSVRAYLNYAIVDAGMHHNGVDTESAVDSLQDIDNVASEVFGALTKRMEADK